jgi:hypothetical protein
VKRWSAKELPLDRYEEKGILGVLNKRKSEWIWKMHRQKKVGELVGCIEKHLFSLQERRRNRSFFLKKMGLVFVDCSIPLMAN